MLRSSRRAALRRADCICTWRVRVIAYVNGLNFMEMTVVFRITFGDYFAVALEKRPNNGTADKAICLTRRSVAVTIFMAARFARGIETQIKVKKIFLDWPKKTSRHVLYDYSFCYRYQSNQFKMKKRMKTLLSA